MDISCVSLEIGLLTDALTHQALIHEQKKQFKLFVSEEIQSFVPHKFLVFWQGLSPDGGDSFPELNIGPGGVVTDADLVTWVDGHLALVQSSPTITVDIGHIAHCCTETPTGNWRKSRSIAMRLGGGPWMLNSSVDAYSASLDVPLSAAVTNELKALQFVLVARWEVKNDIDVEHTVELLPRAAAENAGATARSGTKARANVDSRNTE